MAINAQPVKGPEITPTWTGTNNGGISATGAQAAVEVPGCGVLALQVVRVSGTSHTVKPQGSIDGTNYIDLPFKLVTNGTLTASGSGMTAAGIYLINVQGMRYFRPNVSAISSTTLKLYAAFGMGWEPTLAAAVTGTLTGITNDVSVINSGEDVLGGWSETASADNATATATKAAGGAGTTHYITGVSASFSATATKLLQVKQGSTVVWEGYVYDKEAIVFPSPIPGVDNGAVSAELAASGAGGNLGKVNLNGFSVAA